MPLSDNFSVSDFAFLEQNVVQLKTGANNNLKWKDKQEIKFSKTIRKVHIQFTRYIAVHTRGNTKEIFKLIFMLPVPRLPNPKSQAFSCRLGSRWFHVVNVNAKQFMNSISMQLIWGAFSNDYRQNNSIGLPISWIVLAFCCSCLSIKGELRA